MAQRPMMFLILFLPQPTHSYHCATNVTSCPHSEDEVTERRRKYNCPPNFIYTCLPDEDYDYHERCSPAFYILNGTGGCPYIVKCHDRLGFIYGNSVNFKPCPQNKTGCPPVYHNSYKIQDLYQYPACFYKDGDIPLINLKMALKGHDHTQIRKVHMTGTTSAVSCENQISSPFSETVITVLAVFLSFAIVTILFLVTYFTVYRRRKRKRKNAVKGEEQTATNEEAVPLSSQRSSVRDIQDVTNLEERVPLSSQESSVMDVKDDVWKPIILANFIQKTVTTGSLYSGIVSKFNCKKMVNDVEEECTEKLHSESNLNIKRTSIEDHQGHVMYIPSSKTEELRIENVQRQHPS